MNVSISAELIDSVSTYSYYHRRSIADVVEQAIFEYLDANWSAPRDVGTLGSLPSLSLGSHQMMILDDDDWLPVIALYEKATANQFREPDRLFFDSVKQYGKKCIALAILLGRSRYAKRISSLRYFGNVILEVAAMPPDKIEKDLRYHWAVFAQRNGS